MNTYRPRARCVRRFLAILLLLALTAILAVPAGNAHPTAAETVSYDLYWPLIFKPLPPCDAPPCLISPENGARVSTLVPLFVWNAGPPSQDPYMTFLVPPDDWPQFYCRFGCEYPGSGLVSVRGTGMFRFGTYEYNANFQPGTTYSWQVKRCKNFLAQDCQASQTWTFTTPDTVTLPSAPAIITPTSDSTVQGRLVTFEWSPVEGALDYEFCLVQDGYPPYSRYCWWLGSTQTSLQHELYPLPDPLHWYWHVAALGPQGEGPGSTASFRVIDAPPNPAITIRP